MRLFFIWTDMGLAKGIIPKLKAESHNVVYWVGLKGNGEENFPDIIFHDHFDAYDGKPAPALASTEFEPASPELTSRFQDAESLILTMMNKRFGWMGVDERKHLYYEMLSYWWGVVKKFRPECIIFTTVPHTVYDYLLYELARSLNIRTIMFRAAMPVDGRLLLYEDFRGGSLDLREELEKNKNRVFSPAELSDEWREFYEKQTDASYDAMPGYLKESHARHSFLNRMLLKMRAVSVALKEGTFLEQALLRVIKLFKENIRDEYVRVQSLPDYSQKFVYAPLHYQPESTSSPLGGIFVDQILMIKAISASLPDGWLIYVKEHPTQWFKRGLNFVGSRYRGYYEKIAEIKNVRIAPISTDTYALIKFCRAVSTISGVAGLEALPRGKPVLVFGYPWYRDCPGVFKISDTDSCRQALQKIAGGFAPDPKSVINFLKSVDKTAISGYIEDYGQRFSQLSEEENIVNLSGAIIDKLQKK